MKPAPFTYHRARDVPDAVEQLAAGDGEAKPIAGGQSLAALMNLRLARPETLVDVSRLDDLRYVRRDGDALRIGALARHWDLETLSDPAVLSGFELLPRAAKLVGHYPIRRRGTFGGSVAHADPASEWCMVAQAFDAVVVAMSPRGRREIPVEDFFVGFFETELEPDELLVEVRLPRPRGAAAIEELARRPGDFALVAAVVAFDAERDGCARPRIVLGGVDATPVRLAEAEAVLEGAAPSPELFAAAGEAAAAAIDPVSDGHASAEDRRAIAGVLVRRALERAHATTKEARR